MWGNEGESKRRLSATKFWSFLSHTSASHKTSENIHFPTYRRPSSTRTLAAQNTSTAAHLNQRLINRLRPRLPKHNPNPTNQSQYVRPKRIQLQHPRQLQTQHRRWQEPSHLLRHHHSGPSGAGHRPAEDGRL